MSDRAPRTRSLHARLAGALTTGLAIAFWLGLAPTSVGGDFSYVVVNGNSMEPHLHSGDIVLLRRESPYGIGDVVAYRDPLIGPILHRIRAQPGDRLIIQGDNRETADNYNPLPSEVLGHEAAVWRHGLAIVFALTSPFALGALAFAMVAGAIAWQLRAPRPGYRTRRRALRTAGLRR